MIRGRIVLGCVAFMVAAALLLLTVPASAQRGGRGGGMHRNAPIGGGDARSAPVGDGQYGVTPYDAVEIVNRGEGRQALAWYETVVADAEKRDDAVTVARVQAAIAFTASRLGQLQKAISTGSRALEYYAAHPSVSPLLVHSRVATYATLSRCYRLVGDHEHAGRLAEEGLTVAQANLTVPGVSHQIPAMLNQLSQVAQQKGDLPTALQRGQEAADAADRTLADLPARGLPARGREHVMRTAHRHAAMALIRVAEVLQRLHRPADAEAALVRAAVHVQVLGLPGLEADVARARGDLAQARGDHAAAVAAFQEALTRFQGRSGDLAALPLHTGLARSLGHLNRVDEALDHARQAMTLLDEVRAELQATDWRSSFADDHQAIYHVAAHLALRAKKPDEAFAAAERARARAFLDLLGNHATLSKGATKALVAEEVRLRANLAEAKALAEDTDEDTAAARPRIDAAEREYRAFLARVRAASAEQASLMAVEPATAAEVRALLPEGTTLVEYLVGIDDTIVWTLDRRHETRARRLPVGRATLVGEVGALRKAITEQQPVADVEARARGLYDRLFAPVRDSIVTDRVLVVPHDVLHYLPFAALRTPAGRWLVEDFALATLPSASVLKFLGDKGRRAGDGVVAVGNPALGAGFELGWAEREARFIGERYPAAIVLLRQDATKRRVLTAGAEAAVLHFATHADLNEQNPLDSALLLAPADGNDGHLAVRDLFALDLNARLVVLSACETGLGPSSHGDEVVGLQRAFLYAGTPAVVTTLWKVDDRASYELIRAFYERLATAPAADALRQAQLATLRSFPHPFQWAAFTLTGVTP